MKNKGNKIVFVGLLLAVLAIAARLVFYMCGIARILEMPFMAINDIAGYMNLAFVVGLLLCAAGYVLKFLGEKDVFDIITVATIGVSIVMSLNFIQLPVYSMTENIIQRALVYLFLLGIGINVLKKGDTMQGGIILLTFAYLAIIFPLCAEELFACHANATIMEILTDTEVFITYLFNEVIMLATLIFSTFTASSD